MSLPLLDFAPAGVHLGQIPLLLVSLYLHLGQGFRGGSGDKLARLGGILRLCRILWLGGGDSKYGRLELECSHWLSYAQGAVLDLAGSITCTAGATGSVMDLVVVSSTMAPLISKAEVGSDVPWKPHLAINLELDRHGLDAEVRQLGAPRTVLTPATPTRQVGNDDHARAGLRRARERPEHQDRHPIMGTETFKRKETAARRLGREHEVLITAVEAWLAHYTHRAPEGFILDKQLGRAMGPRLITMPLGQLEPRKRPSRHLPSMKTSSGTCRGGPTGSRGWSA